MTTTHESHSRGVSDLQAHLVLRTKYRRKVIDAEILGRIEEITRKLCERWGCSVVEFNGETDHIHLLFKYYPQMQLSKFINNMKTVTSRMIRKEFEERLTKIYWKPVFWTNSYFIASCGGVTIEQLKAYVQNQDAPSDVA
jgi:putative transposase